MKWEDIMSGSVKLITSTEAQEYCRATAIETYQLIDVRQPGEYQNGHIPGAKLAPLGELVSGQVELNKSKPVIVYCHSGGRSAAAAGWLVEQGFEKVLDIRGGFSSWNGLAAQGPVEMNLNLIKDSAEFPDAFSMAYTMEDGLQRFYLKLAPKMEDPKLAEILNRMASFEDHHKENLKLKATNPDDLKIDEDNQLMEGGFYVDQLVEQVAGRIDSMEQLFSLSLAIEAQAYDFYTRLSGHSKNQEVKALFLEMADEEKGHLNLLSKEMDELLASS